MKNLFLTCLDQVIDLDYVIAIEILDEQSPFSLVNYHLTTGYVVSSRHKTRESAIAEKWSAYQQMRKNERCDR